MKKKYLLLIVIPVIIITLVLAINSKTKKVSIKEAAYDSSYSKLAINILKNKANENVDTNYSDGNKGEMYAFHHEGTSEVLENTDYRYIGDNPNNYVYFNCSDINDTSTCEIWRILGIFPDRSYYTNWKTVMKIKIVREDTFENYTAFAESNDNYWKDSDINTFLNNDYYNRTGNASEYGLYESARNMISPGMYYLGGLRYDSTDAYGDVDNLYRKERSEDYFDYRNYRRENYWQGNIGLPYSSDNYYIYGKGVDETCYNNPLNCYQENARKGWFYNDILYNEDAEKIKSAWLITPRANYESGTYSVSSIYDDGQLVLSNPGAWQYVVPTFYLNPNLLIVSGNGSKDKPYQLMTRQDFINQNYEFKIGDEVYYNNELYHVIDYSTFESDYVAVLKDVPLTEKYLVNIETDSSEDEIGNFPFDYGEKCFYKSKIYYDYSGCTSNFNESYIKNMLYRWANDEFKMDDLVDVDGNKIRLIKNDEIISGLKYDYKEVQYFTSTATRLMPSDESPNFIKDRDVYCWTMDQYEDSNRVIIFNNNYFNNISTYDTSCVDPVINFKKSSIGSQNEYNVGDIINHNGIDYYVLEKSLSDMNYVTVLRVEPLNKSTLSKYSNNNIKSINYNAIAYSQFMKSNSGLVTSYDNSDIKKYIDYWINKNFDDDDLKEVNGYKGRLISLDELLENFYYDYRYTMQGSIGHSELKYTVDTPEWMYSTSFWTETANGDHSSSIFVITNYGGVYAFPASSKSTIRPIVYLKKSAIGKISSKYAEDEKNVEEERIIDNKITEETCTPKYKKETTTNYKSYNVGDEINYKGENYYVIRNSNDSQNYVTVLKDKTFDNKNYNDSLTDSFINSLTRNFSSSSYEQSTFYYKSDTCNDYNNQNGCKNDYESSNIKKIIDNWVKVEFDDDDLVSVNGRKARIMSINDFLNNFGYEKETFNYNNHTYVNYVCPSSTPDFIKNLSFWVERDDELQSSETYTKLSNCKINSQSVYYSDSEKHILPVINLKKSVIGDNQVYYIGDQISYNNNLYYVIENSDSTKNYVVLLKKKGLSYGQINLYSDFDYDLSYNEFLNKSYIIPYYNSEYCNNNKRADCKYDYKSSNVKKIIDKWIKDKDIEKDLTEVDGYKSRLLNVQDLFENLNYIDERVYNFSGELKIYATNKNVPEWIYSPNEKYWTMITEDSAIYIISENGDLGAQYITSSNYTYSINIYDFYAIRPVLNLNKCAIDGGCETNEIEIEDGCIENGVTILNNMDNTLRFISKIVIVLSIIFVTIGCLILGYNYYKSIKERK